MVVVVAIWSNAWAIVGNTIVIVRDDSQDEKPIWDFVGYGEEAIVDVDVEKFIDILAQICSDPLSC